MENGNGNQCSDIAPDEILFFGKAPRLFPLYETFKKKLRAAYPDMTEKIAKTQISFSNRHVFAIVSLPLRRIKKGPKEYMLVSFGLPFRQASPRIEQAVEAYPRRWTHHVAIQSLEAIDDELLTWIDASYQFSMAK